MKTHYYMAKVFVQSFHSAVQYPECTNGVIIDTTNSLNHTQCVRCPNALQELMQRLLISRSPNRVHPTIYYLYNTLEGGSYA